jgi:hypothetical protein
MPTEDVKNRHVIRKLILMKCRLDIRLPGQEEAKPLLKTVFAFVIDAINFRALIVGLYS